MGKWVEQMKCGREEDEKGNTTSIDVCNLTQCVWPQGW